MEVVPGTLSLEQIMNFEGDNWTELWPLDDQQKWPWIQPKPKVSFA